MKIGFKQFILNENHAYLGQKVGDILSAIQDLVENGPSMGTRQLMFHAEAVVAQIRKVLHTHWGKEEQKYLPALQKVGVAIMRSIDGKVKEKTDINSILQGAAAEIEKLMQDMGEPMNNLMSPAVAPEEPSSPLQPTQGKKPQPDQPPAADQPTQADMAPSPDMGQQVPTNVGQPPIQPPAKSDGNTLQ